MQEPKFIKSTGGNCGIYAVLMALDALEIETSGKELEELAYKCKSTNFGDLYTVSSVIKLLSAVQQEINSELKFEVLSFVDVDSMESVISNNIGSKYILMAYYAYQGMVVKPLKASMNHGHWALLYDMKDKLLYGKQSNSKANTFGMLNCVKTIDLYNSNVGLKDIKINWGKYQKCKIAIPKKQLVDSPRCGNTTCAINNMDSRNCLYSCDLNNKVITIYKSKT